MTVSNVGIIRDWHSLAEIRTLRTLYSLLAVWVPDKPYCPALRNLHVTYRERDQEHDIDDGRSYNDHLLGTDKISKWPSRTCESQEKHDTVPVKSSDEWTSRPSMLLEPKIYHC